MKNTVLTAEILLQHVDFHHDDEIGTYVLRCESSKKTLSCIYDYAENLVMISELVNNKIKISYLFSAYSVEQYKNICVAFLNPVFKS